MRVTVKKHTGIEEAHDCIRSTSRADIDVKSTLKQIYSWEHSITRSQIFSVQLYDIPTFVSVHLVRHVTTVPFVTSRRDDRGGDGTEDRMTPVNHRFIANAEALLNMARRRLCFKASPETRDVMLMIKEAIREVDPDLAYYMVPNCIYRGGICPEPKPCGNYKVKRSRGEAEEQDMRVYPEATNE
jgi:hypothetical protein